MFEHDFAGHEELGSSEGLSSYQEQEIEQAAQLYDLSPSEVAHLEVEVEELDSLPPEEAYELEEEMIMMDDATADETMEETTEQADSFDDMLTDGD